MKKALFILILILATILRFYQLGAIPNSLDWDEASLGYTSYSLLLNGTDEYGNSWPLSIRSFNDYKPPAYAYLDIIPTAIFGLNEFSTRFPAAFFGILSVVGVYFLTKEFFRNSEREGNAAIHSEIIALLAMFLMAISPWHLQFSRAAFEGGIAVFFLIYGMLFLLQWFSQQRWYQLLLATLFLAGTLYAYHAARLVVPLIVIVAALRYYKPLLKQKKQALTAIILGILLTLPLALVLLRGSASQRFSSVSIFTTTQQTEEARLRADDDISHSRLDAWVHDRKIEFAKQFIKGYLDHYNINNIFITGDVVERHHAPDM